MIRWLAGGKGDPRDQPVKLYTNLELQVTQSGSVDGEPGSRKLYQIIADEFRARREKRGVPELLAELRRLGVPSKGPAPSATIQSSIQDADLRIEVHESHIRRAVESVDELDRRGSRVLQVVRHAAARVEQQAEM